MKSIALDLPTPSDRELAQRLYDAERTLGGRLYEVERRLAVKDGLPVPPRPPEPRPPQATTQIAAGASLERQRRLLNTLGEVYFKVELAAGISSYFGAVTEVDANGTIYMRMPNGALTAARRIVRGRDLWVRTRLKFEVWYTSPVGSTANFSFLAVYFAHDAGGAAAGAGFSGTWTAPGPAVANAPMKTQFILGRVNSTPHEVVRLALGRADPDDNANDLDVSLVVATFEEGA